MPARDARSIAPRGFLIGRSVHTADDAARLGREGSLDYLIFGAGLSDARARPDPSVGLEALRLAVQGTTVPVLAIGGVDHSNAAAVASTGAAGLAAIRWWSACPRLRCPDRAGPGGRLCRWSALAPITWAHGHRHPDTPARLVQARRRRPRHSDAGRRRRPGPARVRAGGDPVAAARRRRPRGGRDGREDAARAWTPPAWPASWPGQRPRPRPRPTSPRVESRRPRRRAARRPAAGGHRRPTSRRRRRRSARSPRCSASPA